MFGASDEGFRINTTEISDEDLIRSYRTGDSLALETLYSRHHQAGLKYARRLMANKADAEDVAQEAFLKVAAAMMRGNGPEIAFRPYLLRAVRTAAADRWGKQAKETPTDDTGDTPVEDASLASLLEREDPGLVMKAFQSLPVRWMTALWHAEVEREPPRRIAPILGIEPAAVSALLLRARKGLREAYLTAYAEAPPRTECEPTFPYLAATVLGTSSARDRRKVKEHARGCDDCAKVLAELTDVGATMRAILAPLILVPSGVVLPGLRVLPKTGMSTTQAAVLTAAAVLIAAVPVAAAGGLALIGQSTPVPPLTAQSTDWSVPSQQPAQLPAETATAAPAQGETAVAQAAAATKATAAPDQSPPLAPGTSQQWVAGSAPGGPIQAGDSPALAAQQSRAGAALTPGATLAPALPSAPVHDPPLGTQPSTPTATPTAVPTYSPTAQATATATPTSIQTQPPAGPRCTVFVLICLTG
ncbi:sigma-70 family RNA polymerase sigma factor [Arthrobacter sp. ISL-48]|uniref:sigma-70 family RNA polymerase sigma factor n=1 Tax=Arthrobacter sp. ISL-48 TaxID=2819110 RepID=UPI001BE8F4C3|nr:sigma-70 family RNA polymerase sigma factor [Arthrobacter sp. ISL-48]MBT2534179.1 sigma-70 family RNA polymerase sigma factor [Arthrobacter sp. ISL-48]